MQKLMQPTNEKPTVSITSIAQSLHARSSSNTLPSLPSVNFTPEMSPQSASCISCQFQQSSPFCHFGLANDTSQIQTNRCTPSCPQSLPDPQLIMRAPKYRVSSTSFNRARVRAPVLLYRRNTDVIRKPDPCGGLYRR